MQITHKTQRVLDTSVKVLRFVWRHALTLIVVGMMTYGICDGRTPLISGTFMVFAIAACLDWVKMQFKSGGNRSNSREQMFKSAYRNMDSNSMDTIRISNPAWNTNPFAPGSSAYYTRTQTNYY